MSQLEEVDRPTVAYVVSHPIQYQAPLFRKLAKSERFRFVAAFGCDHGVKPSFDHGFGREVHFGVDVLGGYEGVFLPQGAGRANIDRFVGLRLPWRGMPLTGLKPDVLVLHGWRTLMLWQVAAWARRNGIPYFVRGENPLFRGEALPSGWKQRLRRILVRRLLQKAAGVLVLGKANRRFYEAMGVPAARMFAMPYFVDAPAVAAAAAQGRSRRAELRRRWQLPDSAFVVIAVAKLQPRKRAIDLVEALATLPSHVHVLWVGAGETERSCNARARELGVGARFHLTGFQPAEEAWRLMGVADVFAHPAEREKWGLVVNEAMAAGLPVLASDETGAAEDMVIPGETGDIVPTGHVAAWSDSICAWQKRLSGPPWSSERSTTIASRYSVDEAARLLEATLAAALSRDLEDGETKKTDV